VGRLGIIGVDDSKGGHTVVSSTSSTERQWHSWGDRRQLHVRFSSCEVASHFLVSFPSSAVEMFHSASDLWFQCHSWGDRRRVFVRFSNCGCLLGAAERDRHHHGAMSDSKCRWHLSYLHKTGIFGCGCCIFHCEGGIRSSFSRMILDSADPVGEIRLCSFLDLFVLLAPAMGDFCSKFSIRSGIFFLTLVVSMIPGGTCCPWRRNLVGCSTRSHWCRCALTLSHVASPLSLSIGNGSSYERRVCLGFQREMCAARKL
jgi:hypothetical protein